MKKDLRDLREKHKGCAIENKSDNTREGESWRVVTGGCVPTSSQDPICS